MTSWCSILRTVQTYAFVDHGDLPLRAAINWSQSSLCTPAIHYIVSWPPSTSRWSYSHPIAYCFLSLQHPVLHTSSKCASLFILSVAAIAASQWTDWCLHCYCVSARGAFDEAPVVRLSSDSIAPGLGVRGAITCSCRKGEEDDNEKWEVLRNI